MKVFLNISIVAIAWYCFSYAFAFGHTDVSGFIGKSGFFGSEFNVNLDYSSFICHIGFAAFASAIAASGAAERMKFWGWIFFVLLFSLFTFPIVAHWVLNYNGWLRTGYHYVDAAGSSVVHFCGGCAALVLTFLLKPR